MQDTKKPTSPHKSLAPSLVTIDQPIKGCQGRTTQNILGMKLTAVSNLAVQKLVTILTFFHFHRPMGCMRLATFPGSPPLLHDNNLYCKQQHGRVLVTKNGFGPTLRNSCSTQLFQISFIFTDQWGVCVQSCSQVLLRSSMIIICTASNNMAVPQ